MSLPQYIKNFMAKPTWNGAPMKQWLYLGMPELMEAARKINHDECHELLQELGEATELGEEISQLKLDDGSLDQSMLRLRKHYQDIYFGGKYQKNFYDAIDRRKRGYELTSQQIEFFKHELLPTLKELEEGMEPTIGHQQVLEEVCDSYGSMFTFHLSEERDAPCENLPDNLKTTELELRRFFDSLRKTVAKATGIPRVLQQAEIG